MNIQTVKSIIHANHSTCLKGKADIKSFSQLHYFPYTLIEELMSQPLQVMDIDLLKKRTVARHPQAKKKGGVHFDDYFDNIVKTLAPAGITLQRNTAPNGIIYASVTM